MRPLKTGFINTLVLTLVLGLIHTSIAFAQSGVISPHYSAVTTAAPNFKIYRGSRISWLLEDVSLKEDAPISDKRAGEIIKEEITAAMQGKGLELLSSGSPSDYFIAYTVASESTLDDDTLMKRYSLSPGFKAPGPAGQVYEKGTLIIHFIDAKSRQTVWQSVAQANIHQNVDEDQRRMNIRSIIGFMLRKLPVSR